jgi:ABC-type transport system substrate-binding protein
MVAAVLCAGALAADPAKVLHLAIFDIDTLDPQDYIDEPSYMVQRAIYEGLYRIDYLADPPRLVPDTAEALPVITEGGRKWTIHLRRGIHFTPDPAFNGKRRELTADDYVYSLKRWLDPGSKRGGSPVISDLIVGGREALEAAKRTGHYDLDRPLEGLRALDRYTLQLELTHPDYALIEPWLTTSAAAREVVEATNGRIGARAVGTGPYMLKEWKRGSRIVLQANPDYRQVAFPRSSDPADRALIASMGSAPFPRIGTIELDVIEEDVTRLLEFDRGNIDYLPLSSDVATRLLAGDKLRPAYEARGVTWHRVPLPYLNALYFNLHDPVVGGMAPDRIALRRAMALGLDRANLIDVVYAGQALPAGQLVPPGVTGHDPAARREPMFDPAAAQALLDHYGYRRGADGYRSRPDGTPLTVSLLLRSGSQSREVQTLLK